MSFFDRRIEVSLTNPINGEEEIFIPQATAVSQKEKSFANLNAFKLGNTQFRIVFTILVDFGGFISYADIAFYNLSIDTATKIIKKGAAITLKAGYVDNFDIIFEGNINNVLYERDEADTITRVIARGGARSDQVSINKTFGKNVKVTTLIRACAEALTYKIKIEESQFASIPPYAKGYPLNGDPRVYLDKLALAHNFSYTFDKEQLIILENKCFLPGEVVIVSQFNGMEGIPEITEVGVDVNTRLNPQLRIGQRIEVQSKLRTFNFSNLYFQGIPAAHGEGVYRMFKLQHEGDTWGDRWTSKITGFL